MFYQSFGPLVTLPTCCMASEITKIISVSLQSSVYVERLRHALLSLLCLREKRPPLKTSLTLDRTVC